MASIENEQEAAPVAKKGGKGLMMAMGLAVLVLLGVVGYLLLQSRTAKAGAETTAAQAPKTPELYLPLDPAFVVNFQDQDSTRYLQVGVTVMTHDPNAVQAMKDSDPVIRNALVMLFSSQTYTGLSDLNGKKKLQTEALDAVRKIVADKTGKPDVDALYFTSFVMQ
ncbi:flagellar basal body-associated FliL family protein [Dyella acidiphila]